MLKNNKSQQKKLKILQLKLAAKLVACSRKVINMMIIQQQKFIMAQFHQQTSKQMLKDYPLKIWLLLITLVALIFQQFQ